MDWKALRERIKRRGMRNSNCLCHRSDRDVANIIGVFRLDRADLSEPVREVEPVGEFTVLNEYLVAT